MLIDNIIKAAETSLIICSIVLSSSKLNIRSFIQNYDNSKTNALLTTVSKSNVTEETPSKNYFIQYAELPEANADNLGELVQYTGDSSVYIKGMIYQCVKFENSSNQISYYWQPLFASVTDYVTPEMFGAKADGVTNDAEAFRKAFNASSTVYLNEARYFLGEEVIDLSNKSSIEIIGKNRNSVIIGGTFLVNIDSTWTKNNRNNTTSQNLYPLHISGVMFNKRHADSPQIVCACPILVENCGIINYHRFLAMPNEAYVDRVNFLTCNFYITEEDYGSGTLIVGCDGVGQYSDWNGHGDDWLFKDCSMTPIAVQVPLFHASYGNHSISFENCLNPCVCYGSDSEYKALPCIYFKNCHLENQYSPCFPKSGYVNDKALVNYTNCYFHSYAKFYEDDVFSGLNYYTSRSPEYSLNSDIGLVPNDLNKFIGVIIPYGSKFKHQKYNTTKYEIPSKKDIKISSSSDAKRSRVTPISDDMDYIFFYGVDPFSYDASTKITKENISPNQNAFNLWTIDISDNRNFYLHVFRRNHSTGQIQKCVMYIGASLFNNESGVYRFQDGGNSIEGVYKWIDYNGSFPE